MRGAVKILVEVHERSSGIAGRLQELGANVEVTALPIGDYLVANGVLVERKSVIDLHESVRQGRLWLQLGRLRRSASRPFLLVEGENLDAGPLTPASIRGVCLAVLEQRVSILWAADACDAAYWIYRLAIRSRATRAAARRPPADQRPNARPRDVPAAVLAAVPGISVTLANALLERFGTVEAVVRAGPAAWSTVAGIGPTRAAAMAKALL
jgi:ERCC4-type nuclease